MSTKIIFTEKGLNFAHQLQPKEDADLKETPIPLAKRRPFPLSTPKPKFLASSQAARLTTTYRIGCLKNIA